jgi:hypothetical protein
MAAKSTTGVAVAVAVVMVVLLWVG